MAIIQALGPVSATATPTPPSYIMLTTLSTTTMMVMTTVSSTSSPAPVMSRAYVPQATSTMAPNTLAPNYPVYTSQAPSSQDLSAPAPDLHLGGWGRWLLGLLPPGGEYVVFAVWSAPLLSAATPPDCTGSSGGGRVHGIPGVVPVPIGTIPLLLRYPVT